MVEELRDEIIEDGEGLEYVETSKPRQLLNVVKGLAPWKRLTLALLIFFNVALCGCMLLVMAGRVFPPF